MNASESDPNMPAKCPQCGASLPAGALDGLCPACLLQQGAAAETAQPEAKPFVPPTVEEVARLFPQLQILSFIGKGGMGAVYQARQPTLDRVVALKILPPHTAADTTFAERFNREARALAKLNHPNIVTLYEFGQADGLPFFIMEFVDGLNLRQLEKAGRLSPREALQIVPQICEALQFAHDEGIVHRDIKPENILLDKKGRVKIADFGIAKIMGREERDVSITETNQAIGTPQYMAPEQVAQPQSVDHRADIYSLGVVFYEMLTGELPAGKFGPPSSRARGVQVDVRLDEVVLRALEQEPDRRYQQASQVKTAVDTITTTAPPPPPPDATALAQQILARDYHLSIRHCLRRGWKLVMSDFWPLIGLNALVLALLAIANSAPAVQNSPGVNWSSQSSIIGLLVNGPLVGGIFLHFLRRKRGEVSGVETVFSGFSSRYLHLFLGSFVTFALMMLGFLCLILPGIYLLVAWMFTLALVIEKKMDFWPAMELSRKVVSKHWWKFFAFFLVMLLVKVSGVLLCGIGIVFTTAIALAALVHAYDDIFGATTAVAQPPPSVAGPSGTAKMPVRPASSPPSGFGFSKPVVFGLAGVGLVIAILIGVAIYQATRPHRPPLASFPDIPRAVVSGEVVDAATGQPLPGARVADIFFNRGPDRPVREFWTGADGTYELPTWNEGSHELVVSATGYEPVKKSYPVGPGGPGGANHNTLLNFRLSPKSPEAADLSAAPVFGPVIDRVLNSLAEQKGDEALDLQSGQLSAAPVTAGENGETFTAWMKTNRMDLLAGFSEEAGSLQWRLAAVGMKLADFPGERWSGASAAECLAALATETTLRRSESEFATNLTQAGTVLYLLPKEPVLPLTFAFETHRGDRGLLQVLAFQDSPRGLKLRYKRLEYFPLPSSPGAPDQKKISRENLAARLKAGAMITDFNGRDRALAAVGIDAARAGEADLAKSATRQIVSFNARDEASAESARQLARRGLRKDAAEIARNMVSISARDQACMELAVDAAQAGDVESAKSAVRQISSPSKKDEAAQESIRRLVKRKLRKGAEELVREISNPGTRDRALAELAK